MTRMTRLAEMMNLTPGEAVTLPTVIEVFAKKMNYRKDQILWHLETNAELRDYAAKVIRST